MVEIWSGLHSNFMMDAVITPDSRFVWTSSWDGKTKVWESVKGAKREDSLVKVYDGLYKQEGPVGQMKIYW